MGFDLKPNEVFDLCLMNPNPTSRKGVAGPVYRISFEVEKDVWDAFMTAKTEGMMVAAKAMVTETGEFQEPETEEAAQGWIARELKASGFFRPLVTARALGTEDDYKAWVRQQPCAACGKKDYDKDTTKEQTQFAHVNRIATGGGKAIKSPWHGIPLCSGCHSEEHNHGEEWLLSRLEKAPDTEDPLLTLAVQYREKWAWQAFKSQKGLSSMTELKLSTIQGFCQQFNLGAILPSKLRNCEESEQDMRT